MKHFEGKDLGKLMQVWNAGVLLKEKHPQVFAKNKYTTKFAVKLLEEGNKRLNELMKKGGKISGDKWTEFLEILKSCQGAIEECEEKGILGKGKLEELKECLGIDVKKKESPERVAHGSSYSGIAPLQLAS